jgi:hypothetical protein
MRLTLRAGVSARSVGAWVLVLGGLGVARQLPLRDDSLARTPTGRQLLKYIVDCALPDTDTVQVVTDSGTLSLPGDLGLAPEWSIRPLRDPERRQVSSCLAARTNFFGKPVRISLRGESPRAPDGLRSDSAERRQFPYFEGAFFGDYFAASPVAYVCIGDTGAGRVAHLESLLRVCTLPKDGSSGLSRCNFRIVGNCRDRPFVQAGVDYTREVIQVYLPGPPPGPTGSRGVDRRPAAR